MKPLFGHPVYQILAKTMMFFCSELFRTYRRAAEDTHALLEYMKYKDFYPRLVTYKDAVLHPFVLHYHELRRMMYLYCNVCLTLPMLRLLQSRAQEPNIFENNLNHVMLVFIG